MLAPSQAADATLTFLCQCLRAMQLKIDLCNLLHALVIAVLCNWTIFWLAQKFSYALVWIKSHFWTMQLNLTNLTSAFLHDKNDTMEQKLHKGHIPLTEAHPPVHLSKQCSLFERKTTNIPLTEAHLPAHLKSNSAHCQREEEQCF